MEWTKSLPLDRTGPTLGFFQGITLAGRQQMASSAARAVFIVDYVGLNGAFAVNSSPTPKEKAFVREYGGQHSFVLYYGGFGQTCDRGISSRSSLTAPPI